MHLAEVYGEGLAMRDTLLGNPMGLRFSWFTRGVPVAQRTCRS